MSWRDYAKERGLFLGVNIFLFILLAGFLLLIRTEPVFIGLTGFVWFTPLLVSYCLDYVKRKKYLNKLEETFNALDQKYLLTEVVEEPDYVEGQAFFELMKSTNKQMHEYVNTYKKQQMEYREYIEAWVHEIKTPIATGKLMIENQRSSLTKALQIELEAIEGYVDQALYYARSNSANKDYIVKEFSLKECLNNCIKKNARSFIDNKIRLDMPEEDAMIYSDQKWVEFIINQILVNSINYRCRDDCPEIGIRIVKHDYNIELLIKDNGIGINEKDVGRVFEKGFTGENGRTLKKATGMGLYICKTLANKLHLGLSIQSEKGKGTAVYIRFPKSKLILLES
ncbi:MAG: sensor histidine kinase [Bacillus sp. (in: firmicutes)]